MTTKQDQLCAVRRARHLVLMRIEGHCPPDLYEDLMAGLVAEFGKDLPEIKAMLKGESGAEGALVKRQRELERKEKT